MNAPPSTCEAPLWALHGAVEPFVATAAFALWINVFRVLESRGDAQRSLQAPDACHLARWNAHCRKPDGA